MRPLLVFLTGVLLMLLAACGAAGQAPEPGAASTDASELTVLATTQQIADAVANVAGDNIALTILLGPGIDPHTYVPTESDIQTIQNADIIFYNGLHLEAQMERVFEQLAERADVTVVPVADQLDETSLLSWEPEAGLPYDPHVWNDVRLWTEVVFVISETLSEADPTNAETYQTNAENYVAELDELHQYILNGVEQIPQEQRVLITAHDAFGYFGRAYGLAVEAVQGLSTETEASTADVQALADIVAERVVPAIFIETTISPRTIEAVQEAVRAETGREVAIGGTLYSDAMGEPGSGADTYIGMMRHNVDTIVSALGTAAADTDE
ncbi:MAG: zinc ABC transporter solute-binding protein [Chloroflexaceae bacterium]|nr:zinc ABC transporter solute-binding protein [Chloroflexaceae bacterium]NJL35264.1 zinc ABC transporter solute-binding protein [Chloroflexaceae bacterium]